MHELEGHIAGLPLWQGRPRLEPLVGGLSNISFVATDASGKYVVRTGKDYPFHHVFRAREIMTARAAFAAGLGPEVVYDEPGLMVSRFIEGQVARRGRCARQHRAASPQLIGRYHDTMAHGVTGAAFFFWVFHVIRDYAATLKSSPQPADRAPAGTAGHQRGTRSGADPAPRRLRAQRPAPRQPASTTASACG